MGAIAVMPMVEERMTGVTLKALPLLIHYINEIRLYSSFFKLMQAKKNFGAIVSDTLIADPAHVKIADTAHIHWRVIQRYFGKLPGENTLKSLSLTSSPRTCTGARPRKCCTKSTRSWNSGRGSTMWPSQGAGPRHRYVQSL